MIKNAIVMMFDSLQYNYLHCYGNEWIKTPNFDRFAREGVLFENYYTEGLPTIPCRRAMHTGRYTLPRNGWSPLTMDDTTIADLCWGRPIDTALIFDCPMYRQTKFGYTRGFDKVWFTHGGEADTFYFQNDPLIHFNVMDFHEEHALEKAKELGHNVSLVSLEETESYLKQMQWWKSDADHYVAKTITKAVEYLEGADRNKQFYLWIDSFDPHEPWNPPSTYVPGLKCPYDPDYEGKDEINPIMGPVEGLYTEEELHHIRMLYAETVTMCDKWFGYLLDAVRRLGLEENTLLLQVSDHGEPMGNGEHGHGLMRKVRPWPYEELAHAPFIMRFPGCPAGKRVKAFIQSIDVAPTVCAWLGIGVHPAMEGKDLMPLATGEVEKVRDFAIAGYYKYSVSYIDEDWSYIHWLKNDRDGGSTAGYLMDSTAKEIAKAAGNAGSKLADMSTHPEVISEQEAHHKSIATLDGEEKWTCTPASSSEVPAQDELYDRHTDSKQLHNIITEHPEEARRILLKLQTYIADLQNA